MSILGKFFRFRENDPETVKPFLEHLEDLRWTLVKMAITIAVTMIGSFVFRIELVQIIQRPLVQVDPKLASQLTSLGVMDSLTISLKLAFYAGIVLSFPVLLYFIAEFVLPALTKKEKRYLFPVLGMGFALFLTGVCFCYFIVLPDTLSFFFHDAKSLQWTPFWTVREYFSFVSHLTLAFGFAFEIPMVVMALVYLNIVNSTFLRKTRSYAIVLILVLAAVIAPTPDPMTFMALGFPMCLLYESCIWLAWLLEFRRRKKQVLLDNPSSEQ